MYILMLIVALSTIGDDANRIPMLDLRATHPLYHSNEECIAAGEKAMTVNVGAVKGFVCKYNPRYTEV